MASALQRMRLYVAEFGLSEIRLYATAFMIYLAGAFAWFAWTVLRGHWRRLDRKSTRLNSSHSQISYAVFCLKKKKNVNPRHTRHPVSHPDRLQRSAYLPQTSAHRVRRPRALRRKDRSRRQRPTHRASTTGAP